MPSMLLELIGYVVFELIILHNNTTTVSHCRHLDNITFCVFPKRALQGNSGRIDRNMSESRCPKLQKIDRKLSIMTES